jgi:hypothetical protein
MATETKHCLDRVSDQGMRPKMGRNAIYTLDCLSILFREINQSTLVMD